MLRALGVQIVEGTRVLDVGANAIETDHGAVRFQTLIRATEAYPINEGASRPRVTRGFRHGGYTAIINTRWIQLV